MLSGHSKNAFLIELQRRNENRAKHRQNTQAAVEALGATPLISRLWSRPFSAIGWLEKWHDFEAKAKRRENQTEMQNVDFGVAGTSRKHVPLRLLRKNVLRTRLLGA